MAEICDPGLPLPLAHRASPGPPRITPLSEAYPPSTRDRSAVGGLWRPVVLTSLQAWGHVLLQVVNSWKDEHLSESIFKSVGVMMLSSSIILCSNSGDPFDLINGKYMA